LQDHEPAEPARCGRIDATVRRLERILRRCCRARRSEINVTEIEASSKTDLPTSVGARGSDTTREVLEAVSRVAGLPDDPESPKPLFSAMLDEILELSGSTYGYIGEVLHHGSVPTLRTWAITDISWNDTTRELYEEHAVMGKGIVFDNLDTLFGWGLLEGGRLVISNEPLADTRASGRPDGHPPLDSYIGIPLTSGQNLIGQIGLANRPGGFDESLVAELEPLLKVIVNQIRRHMDAAVASRLERELASLVAALEHGVIFSDSDSRVLFANEAFCRLMGYPAEPSELVDGRVGPGHEIELNDGRVVRPDEDTYGDHAAFAERLAAETEHPGTFETLSLPSGAIWQRSRTVLPLTRFETGEFWLYSDITAQARLARELEQLLEFDEMRTDLIDNISHELRTPLTSIVAATEILGDAEAAGLPALSSGKHAALMDALERNVRRLQEMVDELGLVDNATSVRSRRTVEPADIGRVVQRTVDAMAPQIALGELTVQVHLDADSTPALLDVGRFEQAIRNLLSNAIKFSGPGSVTRVSTRRSDDRWLIEVADHGIGIPAEELDRIFTRFYRASNARRPETPGTGLGLTIARGVIEQHGGSITVDSTDQGTTVSLELPDQQPKGTE
jgi:signal transduction histidine kinase